MNFSFTAVSAQTTMSLRYSAGNGNAARKIELDGKVLVANQKFPATANWDTWSTVSVNTRLARAVHNLKVWFDQPAGSGAFLNLDRLTLTPTLIIKARTAARNVGDGVGLRRRGRARRTSAVGDRRASSSRSRSTPSAGSRASRLRYSAGNGDATRKIEIDGSVKAAASGLRGNGQRGASGRRCHSPPT